MKTKITALGAMLTALGVTMMYLGAVTDVLDLSMCALASFICTFALLEFGVGYAVSISTATLLLSLMLLPSKIVAFEYALMAAYMILKPRMERLDRIFAWLIKLLYINASLVLGLVAAKYVFMLPDDGIWINVAFVALGNVAFVLFDLACTKLIILYVYRLRKRLNIEKYLKR